MKASTSVTSLDAPRQESEVGTSVVADEEVFDPIQGVGWRGLVGVSQQLRGVLRMLLCTTRLHVPLHIKESGSTTSCLCQAGTM